MHELGIAQGILEAALEAAARERAERIVRLRVKVGELSGVVEEALRFAFEAISAGTRAEGARLEVEVIAVRCYCAQCQREFEAAPLRYECPLCGTPSGEVRAGRELALTEIEVN
ncbi:MAG: hydrogenase maturation nickel metallochaperone HypA [Kiritimatiellae bacterium]|nr:hydrogenase maturation nickel metallochaperone HypA [Kiritimatiellia bacterium]MDW8457898.1 hydrogenase maturation nickel metallochaperone HypA [Verrucomicrobiota bacterium]